MNTKRNIAQSIVHQKENSDHFRYIHFSLYTKQSKFDIIPIYPTRIRRSTWISLDLQHYHWLHWVNKQLLVKIYIFSIHSYNFHLCTRRAHGRKMFLLYTDAYVHWECYVQCIQQKFFLYKIRRKNLLFQPKNDFFLIELYCYF